MLANSPVEADFFAELNRQCERIIWFAALAALVIWLPYIPTDMALHPDVPGIVLLRLGFSFVGFCMMAALLLWRHPGRAMVLLMVFGAYIEIATGILTGLSGADAVYVGGYLFVLMLVPLGPIPRAAGWTMIALSLGAFAVAAHLSGASFDSVRSTYSLKDLCVAGLVSSAFVYFADRLRQRSWQNQMKAERAQRRAESERRNLETLADLARRANESKTLDEVLVALAQAAALEFGAEKLMLHVVSPDKKHMNLRSYVEGGRHVQLPADLLAVSREIHLVPGGSIAYRTIEKMRSLYIPSVKASYLKDNHEARIFLDVLNPTWLLILPLMVKGEVEGLISCTGKDHGRLTRAQRFFAQSAAGQIAGIVRILRISDEKEKMATVGDMAAGIVHDLKNPVAIIKGSVEIAGETDTSASERSELLRIIDREADRMLSLVQDLLDFSRGSVAISKQRVDIVSYTERVRTVIAPLFNVRGIRLSVVNEFDGAVPLDAGRFLRVLVNIASNAADALGRGGEFSLRVSAPNGSVRFTLADNGPGIPESIRDSLFHPFVTHGKSHGTGLGMAIAKSMVEAHGGTISFETETGKGTTFVIEVPA
jgi:signal transduction histidine kinase